MKRKKGRKREHTQDIDASKTITRGPPSDTIATQQLPIVARESRNIIDEITHVRSIYAGFSSSSDLHLLRRYVSGARTLSHSFSSVLDTIGGASGYPERLTATCNKRQAREYVHRNTKADTAVRATPIAYQATHYTHNPGKNIIPFIVISTFPFSICTMAVGKRDVKGTIIRSHVSRVSSRVSTIYHY